MAARTATRKPEPSEMVPVDPTPEPAAAAPPRVPPALLAAAIAEPPAEPEPVDVLQLLTLRRIRLLDLTDNADRIAAAARKNAREHHRALDETTAAINLIKGA